MIDDLGKADGAQAVGDRQLFQLFLHPGLAAHAGGVEQLDRAAVPVPVDRDGIAGDAGFRAGQQPLLADQRVDQRRLAGIRAADDGDAHRLGLVVGRLVVGIGDILADQHVG